MSDSQKRAVFSAIVTCLLAIAAVFGYSYGFDRGLTVGVASSGTAVEEEAGSRALGVRPSEFRDLRVLGSTTLQGATDAQGALDVDGAATLNSTLATTGNATFSGSVTGAGIVSTGTWSRIAAQTAISVTNGGIITATGSYQPLTSAGTVTATISTSGRTAGDELVLANTAATTINIADSGTAKLSAAAALGQFDTLVLRFDGTNWLETDRSNN